jgi:hypothetical protein
MKQAQNKLKQKVLASGEWNPKTGEVKFDSPHTKLEDRIEEL